MYQHTCESVLNLSTNKIWLSGNPVAEHPISRAFQRNLIQANTSRYTIHFQVSIARKQKLRMAIPSHKVHMTLNLNILGINSIQSHLQTRDVRIPTKLEIKREKTATHKTHTNIESNMPVFVSHQCILSSWWLCLCRTMIRTRRFQAHNPFVSYYRLLNFASRIDQTDCR